MGQGKIKYEPIRKARMFLYGSNFALLYILIFRLASGKELPFSACTANAEIGVSHEAFFCNMIWWSFICVIYSFYFIFFLLANYIDFTLVYLICLLYLSCDHKYFIEYRLRRVLSMQVAIAIRFVKCFWENCVIIILFLNL